ALIAVASSLTAQAFMSVEGLPAAPPESASQKISPEHSSWSGIALTHFLEWGTLPDSALRTASYSAASEILTGLAARPDEVCVAVRRLGQEQTVRRRIAGQFPETAIHRLIDSLDPVNASWMILVIQLLRRLHAERQLVPLQNQAFTRLLWEFALEYLSVHHWHALDAVSFMRFLLQKLAARQKTSYEFLLAGVALRRSWNPQKARAKKDTGSQSLVSSAILTLLEKDIFGTRLSDAPRFVVRPAFQHLYSDLDVLAYWLRWRRLPSWSFAATPEEMAQHIGPLLRELPPEVRSLQGNTRPAAHSDIQSPETNISATSAAVQIEHWLLFGLWPAGAAIPQNAALSDWLERQDDSAWLCALRRCGEYKEAAIRRIITRLSLLFQLRIMELLTGAGAQLVCAFVQSLQGLEKQITVSSAASWKEQISCCVLRHILRDDSTGSARIFSVEMLAHATLRVISLRCQLSYEQLLQALRKKDLDSQTLQDLYRNLEIKLEDLSTKAELASLESRLPAVALEGAESLLHYMESGSLP
ncbi:MAG TPA: contractile injection system tape measure protein, partial [Candidatus Sulfotelmatobacter sp.]|nr:contractile injection system tape measure protein [Candidatus Sulfotelmatobacter sp.]